MLNLLHSSYQVPLHTVSPLYLITDMKSALQVTENLCLLQIKTHMTPSTKTKDFKNSALRVFCRCGLTVISNMLHSRSLLLSSSSVHVKRKCYQAFARLSAVPCCCSIWLIPACQFMFRVPASSPEAVLLILPVLTLVTILTN